MINIRFLDSGCRRARRSGSLRLLELFNFVRPHAVPRRCVRGPRVSAVEHPGLQGRERAHVFVPRGVDVGYRKCELPFVPNPPNGGTVVVPIARRYTRVLSVSRLDGCCATAIHTHIS